MTELYLYLPKILFSSHPPPRPHIIIATWKYNRGDYSLHKVVVNYYGLPLDKACLQVFWPGPISLLLLPSFCHKDNQTNLPAVAYMVKHAAPDLVKHNTPTGRRFKFWLHNFKAFALT